jgi:hypothetical protein
MTKACKNGESTKHLAHCMILNVSNSNPNFETDSSLSFTLASEHRTDEATVLTRVIETADSAQLIAHIAVPVLAPNVETKQ